MSNVLWSILCIILYIVLDHWDNHPKTVVRFWWYVLCFWWGLVVVCNRIIPGSFVRSFVHSFFRYLWWLICAISYYRVFGAKRRKGATRKPAKWWRFRVFAWRPFAPPHESTTLLMFRLFAFCLSYLCLAGRKVATRKHEQNHHVEGFRVATFRPARQKYDTFISGEFLPSICRVFAWRGERSPRRNHATS